jgi:hypothetical protein
MGNTRRDTQGCEEKLDTAHQKPPRQSELHLRISFMSSGLRGFPVHTKKTANGKFRAKPLKKGSGVVSTGREKDRSLMRTFNQSRVKSGRRLLRGLDPLLGMPYRILGAYKSKTL